MSKWMDRLTEMVGQALGELRDEALKITSDEDLAVYIRKYDISLVGENNNMLESSMFNFALAGHFNLTLINEQLNEILPYVCDELGLKCEPNSGGYHVRLF